MMLDSRERPRRLPDRSGVTQRSLPFAPLVTLHAAIERGELSSPAQAGLRK